jgi:hypothetical protein
MDTYVSKPRFACFETIVICDVRSEDMMTPMILWIVNLGGVAVMAAVLLYAGGNQSGHTAFPPFLLAPPFLLLLGIGIALSFRARRGAIRIPAILAAVTGCFGLVLPFALHFTCVLRQYDKWAQSGMPMPPAWRVHFLIGYAITFLVASIIAVTITTRKSGANNELESIVA